MGETTHEKKRAMNMAWGIDFSQTGAPSHSFRFSFLAVGCGVLLFVLLLPISRTPDAVPPPSGTFVAGLAGATLLLGVIALVRRERGHIALASAMTTVAVLGLVLFTVIVGLGSAALMHVFMSN